MILNCAKVINTKVDSAPLQMDMDKLEAWVQKLQVKFNSDNVRLCTWEGNPCQDYLLNVNTLRLRNFSLQ